MVQGDPNFEKRFFVPPVCGKDQKFIGHEDNVEDVAFVDKTSHTFLSCSIDGSVKLWDLKAGSVKEDVIQGRKDGFYCMSVVQMGSRLVTGMGGKLDNLGLWDLTGRTGEPGNPIVQEYQGPS